MSTPYDDQSARPGPPAGYPGSTPPLDAPRSSASSVSASSAGASSAGAPSASAPSASGSPPAPIPGPPPAPAADAGTHQPAAGFDARGHVQRGRISTVWITLIVAAIGLILLIVFIAQNSKVVPIHFLGLAGHLAIGLTVLIAAVVGLLLAAIPGTIRIVQLRKALKTNVPKGQRAP